jgi:hypothetical protein
LTARLLFAGLLLCLIWPHAALSETAPFDLAGPSLTVRVTHEGSTLPVSEVPNLSVGDQLAIVADLPDSQSIHYLMVAAFLRGATNPPPKSWFYKAETWTHKGGSGLKLVVPQGAQQLIVFLAPQTGGDFDTLIDAVRGRPGAFVRASQDLNQASLDRGRLDQFLAAVRKQDPTADPDRLKTVSPLLARSLTIKLNAECLQKSPSEQAPCLMQGQDSLILNDGHSTSIVDALTSGPVNDLAFQLSAAPQAGYGYASPYIGAVSDIARIFESFHTAQYQYIPALATVRDDQLALLLNAPPSFHVPLSVLMTALPAVEDAQSPPLEPVDPKETYCAQNKDLVLPVDGAPLVYSTRYAHDMVLHLTAEDGRTMDLPVKADAEKGGLIVNTTALDASRFPSRFDGVLQGFWGFRTFTGPTFHLETVHDEPWRVSADDQRSLLVGRDDMVHLQGEGAACIIGVELQQVNGEGKALDWKAGPSDTLAVTVPLTDAQPGEMTLLLNSYGGGPPRKIAAEAFVQAGRLDSFTLHAGDASGLLKGSRLDEVTMLTFAGVQFKPNGLKAVGDSDELTMVAGNAGDVAKLRAGQGGSAKALLKDGRTVGLKVVVAATRPDITLISKSLDSPKGSSAVPIQLTTPDEIPQTAVLTFSVRARQPANFSGQATIEVATSDGASSTTLSPGAGLTLEDAQVAIAAFSPSKALGVSAFGPIQFRFVNGPLVGDWQPLGTVVRLPDLQAFRCDAPPERACRLHGNNLFLIDSVSNTASFSDAAKVPEGFTGASLSVPHNGSGRLYIKLHDDPAVINQVMLRTDERP